MYYTCMDYSTACMYTINEHSVCAQVYSVDGSLKGLSNISNIMYYSVKCMFQLDQWTAQGHVECLLGW